MDENGGTVPTNLERYEILKKHMAEEAARVIAEAFPAAETLVTRDYLDARLSRLEGSLTTDFHRWVLTLMATQWLGFAGMIVAIVLKG
jgi:hypothetical protein